MSGFTGQPMNAEHARLIAEYRNKGWPPMAAWFTAQADLRELANSNVPEPPAHNSVLAQQNAPADSRPISSPPVFMV